MEAELPGPYPDNWRSVFWGRGTTWVSDNGERYHTSDRSHKTPNAMTTHELSIVMSKKTKREIRLKRSIQDPDKAEKPKAGQSTIFDLPSIPTEREIRLRNSMKDCYKQPGPSVICDLSSVNGDDEEDDPLPKLHPYTDKMDNT